jgi:hypothetical protein
LNQEDDMAHLAMHFLALSDEAIFGNFGMWAFLSIGAVALFGVFIPVTSWIDGRRKEREAFYKAETIRRVAESSSQGSNAALQMLLEQERIRRINTREGLKIGGLINIGVGIGLIIFLSQLVGRQVALCGLIPGLIGVAMLVYVYALSAPVE